MTSKEIKELIDSGKPLEELEDIFRTAIKNGSLTYEKLEAVASRCKNDPGLYTWQPSFDAREFAREHGESAM